MRIDEITSNEFEEIVKRDPVIILPIGATESHGPHLPLGTDTFQPEYIASVLSERFPERILVAPTLPYGLHSTTRDVPGTIDITFDALRAVVTDILDSMVRQRIRHIVVISGHAGGSHMAALTEACRRTAEGCADLDIMLFSDFYIAEDCDVAEGRDGDGHAGFLETSRMLHIRSDLVRDIRPSGSYVDVGYKVLGDPRGKMPQGIVGDTADASAEYGERINEHIIREIERMLS